MEQPKLNPEEELESLKEDLKKIDDTRFGIRERMAILEDQVREPMLKKKYIGKYFKYKNPYGAEKGWWVYYFVSGVDGVELLVNEFQTDPYGNHNFGIQTHVSESLLQEKITKREWDRELKKFLSNVKKLK